jgi:SAM-dependent methyltransferase
MEEAYRRRTGAGYKRNGDVVAMKPRLLNFLVCSRCGGSLDLHCDDERPDGEIISGTLTCQGCGHRYPITRGVPRMIPDQLAADKEETAAAFGWQWQEFTEMHDEYRDQFLDWIAPIQPDFFRDKVVLDAGCGIGRHTYWSSRFGAREVIGIDFSAAVETAYRDVGSLANVHIVQADIFQLPFRSGAAAPFDFIYSIGVLHHTPDPAGSFHALERHLKAGGTIHAWVYGHENNAIIHYAIDPARKLLTARLPHKALYYLSFVPAIAMQGLLKGVYKPVNERPTLQRLKRFLFYNSYFYHLSGFNFRHNHTIVYDHLVAPTAFYIRREEFEEWFRRAGLTDIELSWRNKNSWRGRGVKPGPVASEKAQETDATAGISR